MQTFTLSISYSKVTTNIINGVTLEDALNALDRIARALKKTRAVVTLTEE